MVKRKHEALARVDSARQRMEVYLDGELKGSYAVSTAAAGMGCEAGSGKTPTGRHRVARIFGHKAEPGQVFKSRKPVKGRVVPKEEWRSDGGEDLILTRVVWLEGQEFGVNLGRRDGTVDVDTYRRYIYVHGTNQEHLLGTPASHGCIRMSNADVIEFFGFVRKYRDIEIVIV